MSSSASATTTKSGKSKKLSTWFRSASNKKKGNSPQQKEDASNSTTQTSITETVPETVSNEANDIETPTGSSIPYHQIMVNEEEVRESPIARADKKMKYMEKLVTVALDETARCLLWTAATAAAQKQLANALKTPLLGDEALDESDLKKDSKASPPVRYVNIPRNSNDPVVLLNQQHHILYGVVANAVPDTEKAIDLHTAAATEIHERWALAQKLFDELEDSETEIQKRWDAYCSTISKEESEDDSSPVSSRESDKWYLESEYRYAVCYQIEIEAKLNTVLQQMASSETKRSERLRQHLQEELLKQQGMAFKELGTIHGTVIESLSTMQNDPTLSKKERIHQVAESLGATAVFPKSSKSTNIPLNDDIALDPSSSEYSKFMKQLLFSGSLLSSHYVHFAAVAQLGKAEGLASENGDTVLVVVTCDRVLHVFDLVGVAMGTDSEDAFRSVLNQAEAEAADRCAESATHSPEYFRQTTTLDWSSYAIIPCASIELKGCKVRPEIKKGVRVQAKDSKAWTKYNLLYFNTEDEEEDFTKACNDGQETMVLFI